MICLVIFFCFCKSATKHREEELKDKHFFYEYNFLVEPIIDWIMENHLHFPNDFIAALENLSFNSSQSLFN
jgi:hypothetical protein